MTYQDRDPGLDTRNRNIDRRDSGFNAMWGWIAGAVVLVLVLVFLFGNGSQNTTTSDINNSPAAPSITTPSDNSNAMAPRSPSTPTPPSETTGQSQQ